MITAHLEHIGRNLNPLLCFRQFGNAVGCQLQIIEGDCDGRPGTIQQRARPESHFDPVFFAKQPAPWDFEIQALAADQPLKLNRFFFV
jgi:hypothetical protein